MTIETAFLDLMPSSVTVFGVASTDAYGKNTFAGSGTSVRCRIQETGQVVKTEDRDDVYEQGQIIFYGTPTITTSSKIALPDGSFPLILSVKVHNDESGAHHTSVSFGN